MNPDLLVDLAASEEDHIAGYGNRPDVTMRGGHTANSMVIASRLHRHASVALHGESGEPQTESPEDQARELERATYIDDLNRVSLPEPVPLNIPHHAQYLNSTRADGEQEQTAEPADPLFLAKQLKSYTGRPLLVSFFLLVLHLC